MYETSYLLDAIRTADVMHPGIIDCDSRTSVEELAQRMSRLGIHSLAITDGDDGGPAVIISDLDVIAVPAPPARAAAASVHFTPGARTAWHTHPFGQTIFVTEGFGLCQRRGGPVEEIRPGDRVWFEPQEEHWHGAAPGRFMTHTAIQEVDESGNPATWGEHVTDAEYEAARAS